MARKTKEKHKLLVKIDTPKKSLEEESNVKKIFAKVHSRNKAANSEKDLKQDEKNSVTVKTEEVGDTVNTEEVGDTVETEKVDNKKREEQLLDFYLGPEYKNCYVHLTRCDMSVHSNNYRRKIMDMSLNSTGDKRLVNHSLKVLNKKMKSEGNSGVEEDTTPSSCNSSAVEASVKNTCKKTNIRNRRQSGDSSLAVNSDKRKGSGQFISNNIECEEISASSVSIDPKCHRNKKRKSSATGDEEHIGNSYNYNCGRKKLHISVIEETHSNRSTQLKNGRQRIFRSEKQQQQRIVFGSSSIDKEESKEEQLNKMSLPPISTAADGKICGNKNEQTSVNTGVSRKRLSSLKNSGIRSQQGKSKFIRTPAEKKMYDEKLCNLESLVNFAKQNEPKIEEDSNCIGGRENCNTEGDQHIVIRRSNNKSKQKVVKAPAALYSVKSVCKHNTENVMDNELPSVIENRESRLEKQVDTISSKDCDNVKIDVIKFSENVVAKKWSEHTVVANRSFKNIPSDLLEGDDNNNGDKSNICKTNSESKRKSQEITPPPPPPPPPSSSSSLSSSSPSLLCTRNLNSSEKLDRHSGTIICDNVEQCSKSSKGVLRKNMVRSGKRSKFSTDNIQHNTQDEHEDGCGNSENEDESISAVESCNVKSNSKKNLLNSVNNHIKAINSDNREPSSKLITLNDERVHHAEFDQYTCSVDSDESLCSNSEEDKSTNESDQVPYTSTIVLNRTSSDSDANSDGEQNHCATNVKQLSTISNSDDGCSVMDKKFEQKASNKRQNNNVYGKHKNTIVSYSAIDDDKVGEYIQYNSPENKDQNLDDNKQGLDMSDDVPDQSLNYSESNQHISKQCFDNRNCCSSSNDRKYEHRTCVISDDTKNCSPEKMMHASDSPVFNYTLVHNNMKNNEDVISKVLSTECHSEQTSDFCVNRSSEVDDCDNSNDDDACSDVLSLFADSMTMDFISTCVQSNRSFPNPFLPAMKSHAKNVFTDKGDHHYAPLNATMTDTNNSRFNDNCRNNVLPEVFDDYKANQNGKTDTFIAHKMRDMAGTEFSQQRYEHGYYNGNKPFGSYSHNRPANYNNNNNITAGTAANSSFESDKKLVESERIKVPNKTVSNDKTFNDNSKKSGVNNFETESISTKFNFKIPKIVAKKSSTERLKDRSISATDKNCEEQRQNGVLSKIYDDKESAVKKRECLGTSKIGTKMVNKIKEVNKISSTAERKGYKNNTKLSTMVPDRNLQVNTNTSNIEKNKFSPVLDKNDDCRPSKLSPKEIVLSNRVHESSAKKEIVPDRTHRMSENTSYVENTKFSPASDKNENCRPSQVLPKEVMLSNKGHESSSVKEMVSDRTSQMNANTSCVEKTKDSPVSDKNDKCKPNRFLPTEIMLKKGCSESSAVKETESSKILKISANTNDIEKIKFNSESEKNDKCGVHKILTKERVQNKIHSNLSTVKEMESGKSDKEPLTDKNEKYTSNLPLRNKIVFNRRSQVQVSEGNNPPLVLNEKKDEVCDNNKRKIVMVDNPKPKIAREGADLSAEASQNCHSFKTKLPSSDNVVSLKKFKRNGSEKLVTQEAATASPRTTATLSEKKKSIENSSPENSKQIGEGLRMFVRKEAFNNVTANKYPSPPVIKISTSCSDSKGGNVSRKIIINPSASSEQSVSAGESQSMKKTRKLNALFEGCCMEYLKTSKCDRDPPCSLSHKVGVLLIDHSSINSDVRLTLNVLQEFVSEAPYPPLSLVQNVTNVFTKQGNGDAIASMSKLFISHSVRCDAEYMENLLKIMLQALRNFYGDTDSSLYKIVNSLCSVVAKMDSKQEVLDKMVATIENTIKEFNKWHVYSSLSTIEDYVWSDSMLLDVLYEFMHKSQRTLRNKDWNTYVNYVKVFMRDSQEENLFLLWKRFPDSVNRVVSYIKHVRIGYGRILTRKLKWFESLGNTVNNYVSQKQYNESCGIASNEPLDSVSPGVVEQPGTSASSFLESKKNISVTCNNKLLSGGNKNIVNGANSSLGSEQNLMVSSRIDQNRSDNLKTFNQPWTDPLFSDSSKGEPSGFQHQRLAGDGAVSSSNRDDFSRSKKALLNLAENCVQNMPTVSNHSQVRGGNREESSLNTFIVRSNKTEQPVCSQSKTVVCMNNKYQQRETNDGIKFQNACSNSASNIRSLPGVLGNEKIAADNLDDINNGDVKNEPPSNRKMYYPRPSGFRQRLNQFNEGRHEATAVHDDQQQQLAKDGNDANRTFVQYPLAEPSNSKSYNNFDNSGNYLSGEGFNRNREDLLCVDNHRRLKRTNSTTDLHIDINNRLKRSSSSTNILADQQNFESVYIKTENDDTEYGTGYLSDDGGSRCYPHQEFTSAVYSGDTYLSNASNVVSRTNRVQQRQLQETFSTASNENVGNNHWRTDFCNRRENSRLMLQQQQDTESHERVADVYAEMEAIRPLNSELNRSSVRSPIMVRHPASSNLSTTLCQYRNESDDRGISFNEEQLVNRRQQNGVQFHNQVVELDYNSSMSVAVARRQISPLSLSMDDLSRDEHSLKRFLNVNDYHHVLNILEKWQNTQFINAVTEHVFVLLGEVNGNRRLPTRYNTFRGLMSTALNSGKISSGLRKSLTSISMTLLLDMVVGEFWTYAYDIFKLLMDYGFPCYSCQVFTTEKQSPAKRNLVFVEVCMHVGDLEESVTLLVKHNMLAMNRQEWSLRSLNEDMVIRNELIKILLTRSTESDNFRLSYMFLMNLVEAQKDISNPINVFRPYELLLRKLLDQMDYTTGFQLFREICSLVNEVVVYDGTLCRALIVICANENEQELARQLVRKAYSIGAYTKNIGMFTVKVSTLWTRTEMKFIIKETLSTILKNVKTRCQGAPMSVAAIEADLHFAVVEGDVQNRILPRVLMGIDNSLIGCIYRLKSVLKDDFRPPLLMSDGNGPFSKYIVVKKSSLFDYFTSAENT